MSNRSNDFMSRGPDRENYGWSDDKRLESLNKILANIGTGQAGAFQRFYRGQEDVNDRMTKLIVLTHAGHETTINLLKQISEQQAAVLRRQNSINLRLARVEESLEDCDILVIPENERTFDQEVN